MAHIIWHIFYQKTNPFIISYILTFTVHLNKPGDIFVAKFNLGTKIRIEIRVRSSDYKRAKFQKSELDFSAY